MGKFKKGMIGGVVFLVAAVGGYFLWWEGGGKYRNVKFVPGDPDVSSQEEYVEYYEALEDAYANDPYGGDTPEETLELFIGALKEENVERASKYFVVEEQDYVKENLPRSFESGAAEEMINFYQKGIVEKSGNDNYYEIDLLPSKNEIGYSFQFILNEKTGKWKMTEL